VGPPEQRAAFSDDGRSNSHAEPTGRRADAAEGPRAVVSGSGRSSARSAAVMSAGSLRSSASKVTSTWGAFDVQRYVDESVAHSVVISLPAPRPPGRWDTLTRHGTCSPEWSIRAGRCVCAVPSGQLD
jgi:hypothetical protein